MLAVLGLVLFFLAHAVGLLLIPFGLPGTLLQVAAVFALAILSDGTWMSWIWVALCGGLAAVGEVIEFLSGQWGARRFGGSRTAAWGALIGGLVGAIVGGIPVPIVGSLIASFVGTFVGALAGEMLARRAPSADLRIGFGAVVGRIVGVATKLALGFAMLIVSAAVVVAHLAQRAAE